MNILAVESSCDETAIAIVRDGREDGSYHEFKYDKEGNIIEEIHR